MMRSHAATIRRLLIPVTRCRALACLGVLALLSACATSHVPQTQEAATYRSRARGDYRPPGPPGDPWGPYVVEASKRFDVPEAWVRNVMRVESGGELYHGGQLVTSWAGAMGLMQVMPETYDGLRARYNLGDDPYDPHDNILAGSAYLREMYDLYGSPGFLAAYNAGPKRLDEYLTRNRPLPDETRRYVAKIGPFIADAHPAERSPAEQFAMNQLPIDIPPGPRFGRAAVRRGAVQLALKRARQQSLAMAAQAPIQAPVQVPFEEPPVQAPVQVAFEEPPVRAPVQVAFEEPVQAPVQVPFAPPLPTPPQQVAQTRAVLPPSPARKGGRVIYRLVTAEPPRKPLFRLVQPAMADTLPLPKGGTPTGQWAIQVGAFADERQARAAVGNARTEARGTLGHARAVVAGVQKGHGKLYRARLTGLSHDAALQACSRMNHGRGGCIVLSPDAQS